MFPKMESTTAKQHQQILPDSTTTILSGKQQEFIPAGSGGLHVSADTGSIDQSFTDLLLNSDNFFLGGSTDSFLSDHKHVSLFLSDTTKLINPTDSFLSESAKPVETVTEILDLTTSSHLLPASTNPTLLGGTLTTEESNLVTSTSQDDSANNYRKTSVIILPQPPSALLTTPSFVEGDNNVYTLTLTDGSIVQLRVQNEVTQQQQQQQLNQLTQLLQQQQQNMKAEQEELTTLEGCCWFQTEESETRCTECETCSIRDSSTSPPSSVAEEVTLPFSNHSTPPASPQGLPASTALPSSAADLLRESLSPVSPREVMPMYSYVPKTKYISSMPPAPVMIRSSSISSEDSFCHGTDPNDVNDGSSGASTYDDDDFTANDLSALFASLDNVTIESLKARLCAGLPEGPTVDLGALLVAAKIDLTVNEIVSPPLTTVKKIMEQKGLTDWQVALCLKIRRRKKNTAAVRSSRRKRNQYVVDLRHHVDDLRKRRNDLEVEHSLLEQLTSLWERLCKEVEAEIQEGVKQQLGFQDSNSTAPHLSPESNQDEQPPQQQPKTIIVMQRSNNSKMVYPNTRGKRRIVEDTVKPNKGRKRILIDDFSSKCPSMVINLESVHLHPRLDDSCLQLNDEVVSQALSPKPSHCSMTSTPTTTATTATTSAASALSAYIKAENLMEAIEYET